MSHLTEYTYHSDDWEGFIQMRLTDVPSCQQPVELVSLWRCCCLVTANPFVSMSYGNEFNWLWCSSTLKWFKKRKQTKTTYKVRVVRGICAILFAGSLRQTASEFRHWHSLGQLVAWPMTPMTIVINSHIGSGEEIIFKDFIIPYSDSHNKKQVRLRTT